MRPTANIVCCAQPGSGKVVLSQTDNTDADNNVAFMDISNKSHIWIEGIEFSNVTCLKACITMTNASQCVITGNRFIHLGNPEVNVWGGTAMVRLYNSADCVISHNSFEDITGDAIAFEGQNTKRNLFCNNTFKDLKKKNGTGRKTTTDFQAPSQELKPASVTMSFVLMT